MRKKWLSAILPIMALPLFINLVAPQDREAPQITADTPVWDILTFLGEPTPNHQSKDAVKGASPEQGETLVTTGFASKPSGGKTGKQSKHFVCTSCHNIQKEDPDLSKADPQARLEYARDNGLPFLQATTLHGAVNRTSFYNGDYEKKYGELVKPARNDLREAIQLCAVECAQGRKLKDWELESILQYMWTLELKLADLSLTEEEMAELKQKVAAHKQGKDDETLNWLKARYLQGSPASFTKPPENRGTGYGLTGNPDNGQLIYDLSCKHCHENKRYSFFQLDDSPMTFKYLKNHIGRYSHASIYQVIRYGQQPLYGKRSYMPQYTQEKMTDQQLEDLRSYIELKAK
ncbi:MAG: cytochrome c [Bacteroidota bacterium]